MRESGSRRRLTLLTGQSGDGDVHGDDGPHGSGLADVPVLQRRPAAQTHAVDRPAVGPSNFQALRDRIGINPTQLRQDRFLDEARETADPLRLMQLFGITPHTAIHYVSTAYPERFTIDPTQA
ncbi:hypothetical protein ACFRAI_41275 [Streptomyces sp. NPDC056637]|uniref:hypothetical protein n=1 Tax=unclassified Streptomyces TaxID=2593676 RepID=UPI00363BB03E